MLHNLRLSCASSRKMAGIQWFILIASVAYSLGDVTDNTTTHNHTDWICYTTDGESAGGSVNYSWCGAVCAKHGSSKAWLGYVAAIIAILLFGSNYTPVKKFDTGDGVFFQWVMAIGIWLVGLVANMALNQPPFFLPAIIGGVLWATGNLMVVPIVKMIGLTMGLTVWGVTNMLSAWVAGVFILHETVSCKGLNYGGVSIVVISVVILAFVKSEGKVTTNESNDPVKDEASGLLSDQTDSLEGSLRDRVLQKSSVQESDEKLSFGPTSSQQFSLEEKDADFSWVDKLGRWPRRTLGFVLSLFSGLLYGLMFLPVQYMKLCDDDSHSCHDIKYIFGHYSGILLASTAFVIIYSTARLNKPKVYPKVILPGLVSGIMWGMGMCGWFFANQYLSLSVSVPIITAGPGFVSSAWGIFVFREIKGWKNRVLYFTAFSISLGGLVLIGLSRCTVNC